MKNVTILSVLIFLFTCCGASKEKTTTEVAENDFYSYSAKNIQGDSVSMADYKGKVVLVVNTASKCGYTPQFGGLEELYAKYKNDGLVILGFPSNQFGNQDPGSNEEILEFCQMNYGVKFPMFSKIDVNGENEHPLFTYLKNNVPETEYADIKWNFTKFLIGKEGKPLKRYESKVKPADIEDDIKELLKAD
ncbi:MAG: glutathione peroxidase [Porphyromonadaceae bacterium]|nr:glutathione peroxidase [Porphyromonadaceae bacterium]